MPSGDTHHVLEPLNVGLLRMNPDQSTRSQAVNGVRFGERNGKTNQQVFRPRQTRVERLCNRLSPTVRFVGVEVVSGVNEQRVPRVFVSSGAFHEGVQHGIPTLRGQAESGGVVSRVVEPGHDRALFVDHGFKSLFKPLQIQQRRVAAGLVWQQWVGGHAKAAALKKPAIRAPVAVPEEDGFSAFSEVGGSQVEGP